MDAEITVVQGFDDLIGKDLLVLTDDDGTRAVARFRELLRDDRPLRELLKSKRPVVDRSRIIVWDKVLQVLLLDGVVSTLLEVPQELVNPPFFHFQFFAHLFVAFHERTPQEARANLHGRLKAGARDPSDLLAFYFELIVAAIYWRTGNVVVPADMLKTDNKPKNDYDIRRPDTEASTPHRLEYAVEVKTIDWTTGFPYDVERMNNQLERLRKFLSKNRARFPEYHASIRYFPSNRSVNDIEGSMTEVLKRLQTASSACHQDFSIRVRPWAPKMGQGFAERQQYLKKNRYISVTESTDPTQPGALTLRCADRRELSDRIAEVMQDSRRRQLDPGKKHVFWFLLIGRTDLDEASRFELTKNFAWDTKGGQHLRKRNASGDPDKGLIAIHIGGNPMTTRDHQGRHRLVFEHSLITGSALFEKVVEYRSRILGFAEHKGINFRHQRFRPGA